MTTSRRRGPRPFHPRGHHPPDRDHTHANPAGCRTAARAVVEVLATLIQD
jgi:lysophospholipase L1-like esterase